MKFFTRICVSCFFFAVFVSSSIMAETLEEEFKIEGIISLASIKALKSELPKKLDFRFYLIIQFWQSSSNKLKKYYEIASNQVL